MLILTENASPLHHDKMAFFSDYLLDLELSFSALKFNESELTQ